MLKVGIIGGTGYVGAELVRYLLMHPEVEIEAISSESFQGKKLSEIYPSYFSLCDTICGSKDEVIEKSDLIFAALPHGISQEIAEKVADKGKFFIDMGADFRLKKESEYEKWYGGKFINKELHEKAVYGLPEFFREDIKKTKIIANPGCYTTCMPLGLAPAVVNNLISLDNIICDCKSGATGAGRNLSENTHFTNVNEGFHPYKIGAHRHIPEVEQTLSYLAKKDVKVTFVPHLLPVNRGILATCYNKLKEDISPEEVHAVYKKYYKDEFFVRVLDLGKTANINCVRFSNYCDVSVHIDKNTDALITVSAIDNMGKGAAGQAVQNMNIMLGFEETAGLRQVPPAF